MASIPASRPLVVIALLLTALVARAEDQAAPPIPPAERPFALADGRCGYAAAAAAAGKPLRVVLMGGSITQGAGASKVPACYWWQVRTRLAKAGTAKGSAITVDQAAVGGTGSDYGAYRFAPHVLAKGVPDLLVLEFAVNDLRSAAASETLEGIVRQAWRANPRMGIVLLYTASEAMLTASYAAGALPASVAAHHRVALHYGLPEVHAGPALQALVAAGEPVRALLPDGVHPGDRVHGLYADLLTAALEAALAQPAPAADPAPLPAPLVSDEFAWARLESLPAAPAGWRQDPPSYHAILGAWEATQAAAPFAIPVHGTRAALLYMRLKDATLTLPGGEPRPLTLPGRPDGLPTPYQLPARAEGWSGELVVAAGATPAQVRLAGLMRILPADERRP